jgi:hypothetical protein
VSLRYTLGLPSSTYEVNPDCRDVALRVGVIGEPKQQTGLSDARVTDEEQLEEVVVSVGSGQSALPGWWITYCDTSLSREEQRGGIRCKHNDVSIVSTTVHRRSWGSAPKRQRRHAEATYYSGFMMGDVGVRKCGVGQPLLWRGQGTDASVCVCLVVSLGVGEVVAWLVVVQAA